MRATDDRGRQGSAGPLTPLWRGTPRRPCASQQRPHFDLRFPTAMLLLTATAAREQSVSGRCDRGSHGRDTRGDGTRAAIAARFRAPVSSTAGVRPGSPVASATSSPWPARPWYPGAAARRENPYSTGVLTCTHPDTPQCPTDARGDQRSTQRRLLQMIDRPQSVTVGDAARELECTDHPSYSARLDS
jgi:hypothetical protein